jgi:hypothetical protein
VEVWPKQTLHATPLPLCQETSVGSLEVRALMCGSLPRPRGEGGRRPGEGATHGNWSSQCPDFSRLHWRSTGVGCPEPEELTPKADAFCPSREEIFSG